MSTSKETAAKLQKAIAPAVAKFAPPAPGSEEEAELEAATRKAIEEAAAHAATHEEGSPAQ